MVIQKVIQSAAPHYINKAQAATGREGSERAARNGIGCPAQGLLYFTEDVQQIDQEKDSCPGLFSQNWRVFQQEHEILLRFTGPGSGG